MEGNGAFGYQNLERNPNLLRSTPPLTAIDRFLWSPSNITQKQIERCVNNNIDCTVVSGSGFPDFWFSPCVRDGFASGVLWPNSQESSAVDELLTNGDSLSWMLEGNDKMGFREEKCSGETNTGETKRATGSSSTLIKGRWTDEEDRSLVTLVKQYGEKKWAQIAEKLPGRVGKQCRERWHNHLRPDIKKDTWSEEEERLLVEAHEKMGNRWAEIAKRIPGRTENVIKNHWNATKRRQNSKRKSKKALVQGGKSYPSVLQDYIRSKIIKDAPTNYTTTTSTAATPSTVATMPASTLSTTNQNKFNSMLTGQSDSTLTFESPTLISHTYDDELLFMQKLFETNYKHAAKGGTMASSIESEIFDDGHLQNHLALDSLEVFRSSAGHNFIQKDETNFPSFTPVPSMSIENLPNKDTDNPHLYSDVYLSDLLNEATSSTSVSNCQWGNPKADLFTDQLPSNEKKEMDLIEMILSSQFSQCSNSSFWH